MSSITGNAHTALTRCVSALLGAALMAGGLLAATPVRGAGAAAPAGSVMAWGSNTDGQLGDGTGFDRSTPVSITGLNDVVAVTGGNKHSVALQSDGTVLTWGNNKDGELGDGTTFPRSAPVTVGGLADQGRFGQPNPVTAVAAGNDHTLALLGDGTVIAWGSNAAGQLGDGTTTTRLSPVAVAGLTGVVAIAAGGGFSVALLANGTITGWGDNQWGQLCYTSMGNPSVPHAGSVLTGIRAIAAGGGHTLVLKSDGTVVACGLNNFGQLGDGTTAVNAQATVKGLTGVTGIAAGSAHSLAVRTNGSVMAWGFNLNGQLGDGTTSNRTEPVFVGGLSGATSVAAGGSHSLALKSDGSVLAWGMDANGQLGDGATTNRTQPFAVPGLSAVAVAAGGAHSLAVVKAVAAGKPVTRLSGADRVATAIAISNDTFPTAGTAQAAVLARADNFPDALAGTPLAVAKTAPLLLTAQSALDARVLAEIQRVLPKGKTVYVLGGPSALDPSIDAALTTAGYTVTRLAGADRFATAVQIASTGLGDPTKIIEATGHNFPDALSAGAAAGAIQGAVLLTDDTTQAPATATYLSGHPGVTRYAAGAQAAAADPTAKAAAGTDRYDTSAKVAALLFTNPKLVGAALGTNFPDALGGGAHIGTKSSPLVLVTASAPIPPSVAAYLAANKGGITAGYLYGGTAVIADTTKTALSQAIS